jgi:hypothetical protein
MSSMHTVRYQPRPVHGRCRWLKPIGDTPGVLSINCQDYTIEQHTDADGQVNGYRLVKIGEVDENGDPIVYDIGLEWGPGQWECTCPDAIYRKRECKHAKAVAAAMPRMPKPEVNPEDVNPFAVRLAECA